MSLLVPFPVLTKAAELAPKDQWMADLVETNSRWSAEDVRFTSVDLTPARLTVLIEAAEVLEFKPFKRVAEAIALAKDGQFDKPIPRLDAFPEVAKAFLRHHLRDGWLYRQNKFGVEAFLVTDVTYDEGSRDTDKPHVTVSLASTGVLGEKSARSRGVYTSAFSMYGAEVTKKKIADILTTEGYLVETAALREEYDRLTEHHRQVLTKGYTEQFLLNGAVLGAQDEDGYNRYSGYDASPRLGRKVIDTSHPGTIEIAESAMSSVFIDPEDAEESNPKVRSHRGRREGGESLMALPMQHRLQVFDLATHEFLTVHTGTLTRYEYDSSLADKLILPDSHRDLLDILTTDIATFTGDIIEGKSAGNVILSKGVPGVGKTLTAEVYSELIERPLYSIHSGSLGVSADSVRKNLEKVFKRAKAWNAVLLLDEADVFVNERGTNITQNAIVAEFLRTMEYFDGLMFMTTNRAANIDEAVISRCAAIIDYHIPGLKDQAKIWNVLARQFTGDRLENQLVEDLVSAFPRIAPRDIKMLLRLGLRVAASKKVPLDIEVFRQVSMFRGIAFDDESYEQHLANTGRLEDGDDDGE